MPSKRYRPPLSDGVREGGFRCCPVLCGASERPLPFGREDPQIYQYGQTHRGLATSARSRCGWGTRASRPQRLAFARGVRKGWTYSRSGILRVSGRDGSRE